MSLKGPITILPAQSKALAAFPVTGAIAVTQDGSVLHVDFGGVHISLNAEGHILIPKHPYQEQLKC